MPGIADCTDREAAWLATAGDSLPALLAAAGGKWDIIQARWPGAKLDTSKRGIYVTWRNYNDQLTSAQRIQPRYQIRLKIVWTIKGAPEAEQAALDAALGDLIARIRGPFQDKTHGARFHSAAQVPKGQGNPVSVLTDPEQTIPGRALRLEVTYMVDDWEVIG